MTLLGLHHQIFYEHGRYKDIDVHVLYNRVNAYDWNRVVRERSVRALKWLTEKFGEYSYPQVTNTDRVEVRRYGVPYAYYGWE